MLGVIDLRQKKTPKLFSEGEQQERSDGEVGLANLYIDEEFERIQTE